MSESKSQLQNSFSIQLDDESTLNEFINILEGSLRLIPTLKTDEDQTTYYSSGDVSATIQAILGYINEQIPGRFKMVEVSPQNYTIQYTPSEENQK